MSKKKRKQYITVKARTTEPEPEIEVKPASTGGVVQIGDIVTRRPVTFSPPGDMPRHMKGRVVYVHPLGRFHTVEFGAGAKAVRESFSGVRK